MEGIKVMSQNAPKKDKTVLLTTERIGAKSLKKVKIDRKARNFRSRGARIDVYNVKLKVGGETN